MCDNLELCDCNEFGDALCLSFESLLGHYTVLTGKELLIFRRCIVPSSSGSDSCPSPLLGQFDPQDGGSLLL